MAKCGNGITFRMFQLVSVLLAVFLLSCASASIQSTRDPAFVGKLDRVYVLVNQGQIDKYDADYTPALTASIKEEFRKRGVAVMVRVVDPLVLDERTYDSEVERYKPNGLLVVRATATLLSAYGGVHRIDYDASLVVPQQPNRRIWRAQISADGGTAVVEKKMRLVAEELVGRLHVDHLIP